MFDKYSFRPYLTWAETDDVADYYRRGKIFLLCSVSEGLSLTCMEAIACGMFPVASDCGDMADIVRGGHTGVLLPVTAPLTAYAYAVLRILDRNSEWSRMSHASADLIAREHGFESASTAWRSLLPA